MMPRPLQIRIAAIATGAVLVVVGFSLHAATPATAVTVVTAVAATTPSTASAGATLTQSSAPSTAQPKPVRDPLPDPQPDPQLSRPANDLTLYSSAPPGTLGIDTLANAPGESLPGYAVVRHVREITLSRGANEQRITDVARLIDPTTVSFESLTDPAGTRVIEQSFQFDLISPQRLLERFVDREISVDQPRGNGVETTTGTLLSAGNGLTLRLPDGTIQIVPANAGVRLPALPGGLITRPTLVWDLEAQQAGLHRTRISYQTRGIAWWADYNLAYSEPRPGQCALDIGAWVSIVNRSGASYPQARLKLVAGDVQRLAPGRPRPQMSVARADTLASSPAPGFEQRAFFEYHLYTLGRSTTLPDNSTRQIELFPSVRGVGCEKSLVYQGGPTMVAPARPLLARDQGWPSGGNTPARPVDVHLSFRNSEANRLGMPLPGGRIRVSQLDQQADPANRTLEFIGEDAIAHTPRDETVRIRLGAAFDVVAERRQTGFQIDNERREMIEDIEVEVRNRKTDETVMVTVREQPYRWTQWQITRHSHPFDKVDARTLQFPLKLAPGASAVLRYTVRYNW